MAVENCRGREHQDVGDFHVAAVLLHPTKVAQWNTPQTSRSSMKQRPSQTWGREQSR